MVRSLRCSARVKVRRTAHPQLVSQASGTSSTPAASCAGSGSTGQLRPALQEAIEAPQITRPDLVSVAERAHPRDVLAHERTEHAPPVRQRSQPLRARSGSHLRATPGRSGSAGRRIGPAARRAGWRPHRCARPPVEVAADHRRSLHHIRERRARRVALEPVAHRVDRECGARAHSAPERAQAGRRSCIGIGARSRAMRGSGGCRRWLSWRHPRGQDPAPRSADPRWPALSTAPWIARAVSEHIADHFERHAAAQQAHRSRMPQRMRPALAGRHARPTAASRRVTMPCRCVLRVQRPVRGLGSQEHGARRACRPAVPQVGGGG